MNTLLTEDKSELSQFYIEFLDSLEMTGFTILWTDLKGRCYSDAVEEFWKSFKNVKVEIKPKGRRIVLWKDVLWDF